MIDTPQVFVRSFQYRAQVEPTRTVLAPGGEFPQWFMPPSQPRNARRILAYQPTVGPPNSGGTPMAAFSRRHKLSLSLGAGFS